MQTTLKADTDYEELVSEAFINYFGSAVVPMQRFYQRISDINHQEGIVDTNQKLSWLKLGIIERMKMLERDTRNQ